MSSRPIFVDFTVLVSIAGNDKVSHDRGQIY